MHGHLFNPVSFVITLREVLFSPAATFRQMMSDASLFNALLFGLIGGTVGGLFGSLWQYCAGLLWPSAAERFPALFGTSILPVISILFIPLVNAIALFLVSAILHAGLKLAGGAHRLYPTTFKVYAYAQGATALFGIVPVLGTLTGFVWALAINVIGLREAHNTTTGKSALAVLIPIVLCFTCVVLAVLVLLFLVGLNMVPWFNR
ncbi:MAG: YIP1 family protein [Fibrobacterota bacterium]